MSRGGPHNRGKALAHNTSGLPGIRFAWMPSRSGDWLYPYVRISWHGRDGRQRQRSYSLNKHGIRVAMKRALEERLCAGYVTPTVETAMAAARRSLVPPQPERQLTMKKLFSLILAAVIALCTAQPAFAWSGSVTGNIDKIEVYDGNYFALRYTLIGVSTMCTGSSANFAYLISSDAYYDEYRALLKLAKAMGWTVQINTTVVSGYCHIGDIVVQ